MPDKKNRSKLGKMSRNKGKGFERDCANKIKKRGFDCRRGQQFRGGSDSPDIVSESLSEFNFECKAREQLNLWETYEKCLAEAPGKVPVTIWKKNHKVPLVIMEFHDWMDLLQFAKGKVDEMNKNKVRVWDGDREEFRRIGRVGGESDRPDETSDAREDEGHGRDPSCPSELL